MLWSNMERQTDWKCCRFSNFSFHAVKNFTTAEGGAAVWKDIEGIDNETLYHQYQLLSLHGQSKDALAKHSLVHGNTTLSDHGINAI